MKRIICALPLPYGPNWGFWTRDAGLMVLTLRDMGYDAWLVALGDATTDTTDRPVLAVARADLDRPEWWQSQRPDAVVLSTGSATRYDAVRKAALTATPRVVERLDTDGVRSARLFPRLYFNRVLGGFLDGPTARPYWRAVIAAAARTAILYAFPRLLDVRMVKTMQQLPAVMAESPVAAERIQQMFETFGGKKHRVVMIPHPVNEKVMQYDGSQRGNQIITVGRWNSYQKDYPLLRQVLRDFLERHPEWTACVAGSGVPERDQTPRANEGEWRSRLVFHAHLPHEKMVREFNRSKIYVMVSRYEGFSVAASEALCCGCSVVSASDLATASYTAQDQSGTVAETRSTDGFREALDRDAAAWNNGERDPAAIAATWRARLGSEAVARATVALLESTPPIPSA